MAKAQIFYADIIIGTAIFAVAVVLFLMLNSNIGERDDVFGLVVGDAAAIASSVLSAGNPDGWSADNVNEIGLTDGQHRLNSSKVSSLMNMSPALAQDLFGTSAKFIVFVKDRHNNVLNFNGCALNNAGIVVENITAQVCENFTISPKEHLVSIERLVIHEADIAKISVQVWI
ncbi:hypothetical protein HYX10_00115 [Candidatus Woesearchaeota archaeon]|nr:hypothetical protein [Candidatus Woesearchaeota archaeon]